MRIRIILYPDQPGGETVVGYNYFRSVASAFYNLLRGTEYNHLHDSRSQKFFSFSRLFFDNMKTTKTGIKVLGAATLWYTSADEKLLLTTKSALEDADSVNIEGVPFRVLSVSEPQSYASKKEEDIFITMSPALVRKTIKENDELKQWEIGPDDANFVSTLVNTLKREYAAFHESKPPDNLEVLDVWDVSRKMIKTVDIWHRVYYFKIKMRGASELLSFAYDTGIGDKNSMGFGMVRSVFDGIPIQTIEHLKEGLG